MKWLNEFEHSPCSILPILALTNRQLFPVLQTGFVQLICGTRNLRGCVGRGPAFFATHDMSASDGVWARPSEKKGEWKYPDEQHTHNAEPCLANTPVGCFTYLQAPNHNLCCGAEGVVSRVPLREKLPRRAGNLSSILVARNVRGAHRHPSLHSLLAALQLAAGGRIFYSERVLDAAKNKLERSGRLTVGKDPTGHPDLESRTFSTLGFPHLQGRAALTDQE